MTRKYNSASDSLRPGQLNRMVADIKDSKPVKKPEEIVKKWNSLKDDKARWLYVRKHPEEIVIWLDNDMTCACLNDNEAEDFDDLNDFDNWIGNAPGLYDLFGALLPRFKIVKKVDSKRKSKGGD